MDIAPEFLMTGKGEKMKKFMFDSIVSEPAENYRIEFTVEQAQRKTISILENQLIFANTIIENYFKKEQH